MLQWVLSVRDGCFKSHLSPGYGQGVCHLPHGDSVVPQPVRHSEGVQGQSQDSAGVVPQ